MENNFINEKTLNIKKSNWVQCGFFYLFDIGMLWINHKNLFHLGMCVFLFRIILFKCRHFTVFKKFHFYFVHSSSSPTNIVNFAQFTISVCEHKVFFSCYIMLVFIKKFLVFFFGVDVRNIFFNLTFVVFRWLYILWHLIYIWFEVLCSIFFSLHFFAYACVYHVLCLSYTSEWYVKWCFIHKKNI